MNVFSPQYIRIVDALWALRCAGGGVYKSDRWCRSDADLMFIDTSLELKIVLAWHRDVLHSTPMSITVQPLQALWALSQSLNSVYHFLLPCDSQKASSNATWLYLEAVQRSLKKRVLCLVIVPHT